MAVQDVVRHEPHRLKQRIIIDDDLTAVGFAIDAVRRLTTSYAGWTRLRQ